MQASGTSSPRAKFTLSSGDELPSTNENWASNSPLIGVKSTTSSKVGSPKFNPLAPNLLNPGLSPSRKVLFPDLAKTSSGDPMQSGEESQELIDSDVEDELFEQRLRDEGEAELDRDQKRAKSTKISIRASPWSTSTAASSPSSSPPPTSSSKAQTSRRNRESFMGILLRLPLLIVILLILFVDVLLYFIVRQYVVIWEYLVVWRGRMKAIRTRLNNAKSYKEWETCARELDKYLGNDEWTKIDDCGDYDVPLIRKMARKLKKLRTSGESTAVREVRKVLAHGACKADVGGVQNGSLYSYTYFGTKQIVESYVEETVASLNFVAKSNELSLDERKQFLKLASKNYGRTALCLSGGATFAYYHLGLLKALFEEGLLPPVITGTSGGSLVAAMICVRTDAELRDEVFKTEVYKVLTACSETLWVKFKRLFKTGAMFDEVDWQDKIQWITKGALTFSEAYKRTGRILNISVLPDGPHATAKVLNYITAPDTVIYSAVIASSAIPGILRPIELIMKDDRGNLVPYRAAGRKWRDGSLTTDIPEKTLHQLFNVNYTIVSQANPHIVLWFYHSKGAPGSPAAHRYGRGWRGGFVASTLVTALKLDLIKWVSVLRDLELARVAGMDLSSVFLQRFEGNCTITGKRRLGPTFDTTHAKAPLPPIARPALVDYIFILSDPNERRMQRYFQVGAERTFPKIHMIENRMRIEQTLARLRAEIAQQTKMARISRSRDMRQRKMSAPEMTTRNNGAANEESDSDSD
ncbi:hypothetical protein SmJEL517_g02182 [Synchytrium microbalum]|uniref:Patatin-like phospholipase domain-containing protein n=1 Tax=Synchytrium microbalum TaxID=1806994 RepID=A0A507CD09_9FUNG|nr:uncharacterized protein SmJEL517_g02182 [Synchytrium microbalum]TPX35445.1 hypothetical protein SmJEL517_g02182 [Synchytrium microbalum]